MRLPTFNKTAAGAPRPRWQRWALGTAAGFAALVVTAAVVLQYTVSDARLTTLVQKFLDAQFAGELRVGNVHWSLPVRISLDDVRVAPPHGEAVLVLRHAHASVALWPLLHKNVVIAPLLLEGGQLHIAQAPGADGITLADAFAPRQPTAADPNETASTWVIKLDDANIAHVDVDVALPALQATLADASLERGQLKIDGNTLSLTADLTSPRATLKTAALTLPESPFALHVRDGGYQDDKDGMVVHVDDLSTVITGASLSAHGQAMLGLTHVRDASLAAQLQLDTQAPWLTAALPTELAQTLALRGQFDMSAALEGTDTTQSIDVHVLGQDLSIAGANVDALDTAAKHDGDAWHVDSMRLQTKQGIVEAHGDWAPTHHAVWVKLQDVALRALASRFMAASTAMLPERLTCDVQAEGASLAPLATHVVVVADARGLSQKALPGVPPSVHLAAAANLLPEAVNVERFELQGDGANVQLHGLLPLLPGGALDAEATLEHAHPNTTFARLQLPLTASGLSVHLRAGGTLEALKADGNIDAREVAATGLPPTHIQVPLVWSRGALRADGAFAQNIAGRLVARGQVTVQDAQGRWLQSPDCDAEVLASKIDFSKLPQLQMQGKGEVQIRLHGDVAKPRGSASVRLRHLVWQTVDIEQAVALLHSDGTTFKIDSMGINTAGGGKAELTASLQPRSKQLSAELKVRSLPAAWLGVAAGSTTALPGHLQMDGSVKGTLDAMRVVFSASTPFAKADLHAAIEPPRKFIDAEVHANTTLQDALAAAALPVSARGDAVFALKANGMWEAPTLTASLQMADLDVQGSTIDSGHAQINLTTRADASRAYDVVIDIANVLDGNATVALEHGIKADGKVQFAELHAADWLPALRLRGIDVFGKGALQVHYSEARGVRGALRVESLTARVENQKLELTEPVDLALNQDNLTITDLRLEGAPGAFHVQGNIGAAIDAVADASLDMGFVSALVPVLGAASGTLAINFNAHGSLKHPVAEGGLEIVKPLTLRPRGTLFEIRVDEGSVALQNNSVVLHTFRGRIGGGTFTLAGDVGLFNMLPKTYNVHLRGSDLPLHTKDLVVEANVTADAIGEGLLPLVRGRVDIIRGRYLKKFVLQDFNFVSRAPDTSTPLAQRMPELRDLKLDIVTTSLSGVDVKVDAGAFAVQADIDTDLHITGSVLTPHIDGKVSAEHGSLIFPKANLQLTQAIIDFVPGKGGQPDTSIALVAEGDVTPSSTSSNPTPQTFSVTLKLDGSLEKMTLDLQSNPVLGRLDVLTLLTTGHASLSELTQSGSSSSSNDGSTLDAALAFAGAQVSGPITQFAERQLERTLNLRLELGAEVSQDAVRVTAAKTINSRLRLEGAYQVGMSADQSTAVSTRAQLSLTDRFLLEGGALRDLTTSTSTPTTGAVQSNLELKWRLLGN